MLGEGLNGDGKNSSAQVNISTSESVHLKLSSRQAENKPPAARRHLPTLELRQLEDPHLSNRNQPESESSSRLFTFMDEKEVERKIIQNYIYKNTFKNHSHLDGGQQPQKEKCKGGIVRMIEDSKKKRDEFLKKLTQNTSVLKENRSISKLNKMSRSKTPKNITVVQNKYETLCPRSRSKTPRLNPIKQNTPKTHREVQLFRAKSNLGKENVRNSTVKDNSRHNGTKGCKEQEELLQALEPFAGDQNIKDRQNLNQKELLKKKRQLERQLTLVNETLLVVKKVDNGKKKGKVSGNGKGARKKSTKRLSKA